MFLGELVEMGNSAVEVIPSRLPTFPQNKDCLLWFSLVLVRPLNCRQRLGSNAARQLLKPEHHVPNALIVDLGARLIDDAAVLQTFREWQADNKHVKLSGYLDAIGREFDELNFQGVRNRIVDA